MAYHCFPMWDSEYYLFRRRVFESSLDLSAERVVIGRHDLDEKEIIVVKNLLQSVGDR
jgi:hypothetical protein